MKQVEQTPQGHLSGGYGVLRAGRDRNGLRQLLEKIPRGQKTHKPLPTPSKIRKSQVILVVEKSGSLQAKSWPSQLFTAQVPMGPVAIENFMSWTPWDMV